MASNLSLQGILDSNKLIDPNYVDRLRNLRIVLTKEKFFYILDSPNLELIREDAFEEKRATHEIWLNDSMTIKYIMLASMSNKLQRQHQGIEPQSILLNLKELYREHSRTARYKISKQLYRTCMSEGSLVQVYVLKMINLIS